MPSVRPTPRIQAAPASKPSTPSRPNLFTRASDASAELLDMFRSTADVAACEVRQSAARAGRNSIELVAAAALVLIGSTTLVAGVAVGLGLLLGALWAGLLLTGLAVAAAGAVWARNVLQKFTRDDFTLPVTRAEFAADIDALRTPERN